MLAVVRVGNNPRDVVSTMTDEPAVAPKSLDDVPGWFPKIDQRLFTWIFERQLRQGLRGDVVELGAYLGKSAILIGRHVRDDESFTVCDLFEGEAPDSANQREMTASYPSLTREGFEANYRAFHAELPVVIQGPSSVILDHVRPASCRFMHVDASHLYEHVSADIRAARVVLAPGGILVCDDYRSEHTPGVAAAVWEAIFTGDLRPICITRGKLYGVWGDPAAIRSDLLEWVSTADDLWHEVQQVAGWPLVRVREASSQQAAAARQEFEQQRLSGDLAIAEGQLTATRRQLAALRGSRTYRIGRAVTAPMRGLRKLFRR